jgi:hypothetical protein
MVSSKGYYTEEQQDDVLDIQGALRKDVSGVETKEMICLLQAASTITTDHMRQRLSQAEYKGAESLNLALHSAEKVLRKVWESIHQGTLH